MPELTNLSEIEARIRAHELVRDGSPTLSTDYVLDQLLLPLLAIAKSGPGAVTFAGALRELSRVEGRELSAKYLTRKLARLDGRSRLDVWREQGLAEQNEDGIWLISRVVLATPPACGAENDGDDMDANAAADALYDECA